jgi:DNA-binding response OmpR family regulator
MIGGLLHNEGFQVREATDSDEGLALAGPTSPDVIVLDLRLPATQR